MSFKNSLSNHSTRLSKTSEFSENLHYGDFSDGPCCIKVLRLHPATKEKALAGRIRCEWVETGHSDGGRVFMLASPDSSEAEEVNKLCVRSSPADVCFVEEEQGASCGQTWRSRVNNRPHGRAAAAALQRAVDAEEETETGHSQTLDSLLKDMFKIKRSRAPVRTIRASFVSVLKRIFGVSGHFCGINYITPNMSISRL